MLEAPVFLGNPGTCRRCYGLPERQPVGQEGESPAHGLVPDLADHTPGRVPVLPNVLQSPRKAQASAPMCSTRAFLAKQAQRALTPLLRPTGASGSREEQLPLRGAFWWPCWHLPAQTTCRPAHCAATMDLWAGSKPGAGIPEELHCSIQASVLIKPTTFKCKHLGERGGSRRDKW